MLLMKISNVRKLTINFFKFIDKTIYILFSS